MPAANVIQLRQLLAERFPNARLRPPNILNRDSQNQIDPNSCWPTGIPQIDDPLLGGLCRGAVTEIIGERTGSGSASLLSALIRRASEQNDLIALIDGSDSLDVCAFSPKDFSRLLWVRCRSAEESLKAADLLLRDANLRIVLLDLAINPSFQLRTISATTWYRFQRIIEQSSIVFAVLTPHAMISAAQTRLMLSQRHSLDSLDQTPENLLKHLHVEISDSRFSETPRAWHRSA